VVRFSYIIQGRLSVKIDARNNVQQLQYIVVSDRGTVVRRMASRDQANKSGRISIEIQRAV